MSIKSVTCPQCKTSMNVAASMASTKCQSCGTVFAPGQPHTGQADPGQTHRAGTPQTKSPAGDRGTGSSEKMIPTLIVGAVILLAVIGISLITLFKPSDNDAAPVQTPPSDPAVVESNPSPETDSATQTTEFREIDLPESTRKKIYSDYKKMVASSLGKSKKIPKGIAGQALNNMLQTTVDRDLTQTALIHGISDEDIQQIIAEGQAKGW